MNRRCWLAVAVGWLCFGQSQAATLRGKLIQSEGHPPAIESGGNRRVAVEGDAETMAVLGDVRLAGAEFELLGEFKTAPLFSVGPFYSSRSVFVHKNGKKYTISYWCSTCSIRAYTPGKCVCCQQETELDLEEVH